MVGVMIDERPTLLRKRCSATLRGSLGLVPRRDCLLLDYQAAFAVCAIRDPGVDGDEYGAHLMQIKAQRRMTGWLNIATNWKGTSMPKRTPRRRAALMVLAVGSVMAFTSSGAWAQEKPQIAADARNAVQAMGKTLANGGFSFHEQTIREYTDANGQPLHIFHSANAVVRRPDRLAVDATGDDGATKVAYDGKNLILYSVNAKRYATLAVSGPIGEMLAMASKKMGMDFPLADLLAENPAAAFLAGITSGYVVNTVSIDGVLCLHMFFEQPPGIELELWAEKSEQALPRRLIVTYRSIPGEPRFIAVLSDWKTGINPPNSDFELHVPEGATKVELGQEKP